jgi:hypothetical protein
MAALVLVEREALDRLTELGLTAEIIERAIMRAEAEAATCTAFDPPMMAGFMRYGRTVRFLREDLVPLGWDYDNPRNFCRTINPGREFAIVSTSGDEATGNPKLTPTTKYPKGYATAQAVDTNGQLAFEFNEVGIEETPTDEEQLATWFLLYHVTDREIRAEISLPSAMVGGSISDWQERIILPAFSPDGDPAAKRPGNNDGDEGEYVVEVNRR